MSTLPLFFLYFLFFFLFLFLLIFFPPKETRSCVLVKNTRSKGWAGNDGWCSEIINASFTRTTATDGWMRRSADDGWITGRLCCLCMLNTRTAQTHTILVCMICHNIHLFSQQLPVGDQQKLAMQVYCGNARRKLQAFGPWVETQSLLPAQKALDACSPNY